MAHGRALHNRRSPTLCARLVAPDTVVENVRLHGCYRDGVSVEAVTRAHVHNVVANDIGYFLPAAPPSTADNWIGAGVLVQGSDDVSVENLEVTQASHGLIYWGGNADKTSADYSATYQVNRLRITGARITDVRGGCLWGSRGQDVQFANNFVGRCGDVGIDAEGSDRVIVNGNTVYDTGNGGITAFYSSTHMTVTGNSVSQHAWTAGTHCAAGWPRGFGRGAAVHLNGVGVSSDVVIANKSLHSSFDPAIATDRGVVDHLLVEGNRILSSGSHGMRFLYGKNVAVVGNTVDVTGTLGISLEGIQDAGVLNNRVHTASTSTAPFSVATSMQG